MKATLEAWQLGCEDGWDDGYHDKGYKAHFHIRPEWSEIEVRAYTKGYEVGYDDGSWNS